MYHGDLLTLYTNGKILLGFKLKEFADNKMKQIKKLKFDLERAETLWEKEKMHFLLFR